MTTTDLPIRERDQIRQDCARKRMTIQISEHFKAILGCLLSEDRTTPRLVEMVITPDSQLLGSCVDDPTFQVFLRSSKDLIQNTHDVAPAAELEGDEVGYLVANVVEIKRQR